MAKLFIDETFKNYLLSSYPIDSHLLERLMEDLGEYYSCQVKDFIVGRHRELHEKGKKNQEIYSIIQKELNVRLFAGPPMSIRQIRRVIYG